MAIKMNRGTVSNDFAKPKAKFGVRHFQVFLVFLGIVFIFLMKVDMSLAIVAMTDSSQNNSFNWSYQRQSVILSSFKWGYLISKIPGGILSARFGGKIVMVICGVINCVASLFLPMSGYYGDWQAVCSVRFIQGLAQGVLMPTVHTLIGKWAPLEERAFIASVLSSGNSLGTGLEYIMAGYIANYWGWQAIFYVNSVILGIWTVLYMFMGSSSPQESKSISNEELFYIQKSLGLSNKKRVQTPWKAMLTSGPFITLLLVHTCTGWGYWTILTEMPTYLNKVMGVNIKANGLMSAVPYFAGFATCFIVGPLSDYAIAKRWVGVTACRKINNSISHFGQAAILIILTYVANDLLTAGILLTVCVGISSASSAGFNLVHLDLAPNHAGTMMGITGFTSNLLSTFAPLAAGWIINDETQASEWRKVFFLSAGLFCISNVIFLLFGTCKRQKWNEPNEEKTGDQSYTRGPDKIIP